MNWPGGSCFAVETLLDAKGRRIVWCWVVGQRKTESAELAGWGGVYTLPRVVSLAEGGGHLLFDPLEELEALRTNHRSHCDMTLKADNELRLDGISGECLELMLEIDTLAAKEIIIKLRCSPDEQEQTLLIYDKDAKTLSIDTTNSSLGEDMLHPCTPPMLTNKDCGNVCDELKKIMSTLADDKTDRACIQAAPFKLNKSENLKLRIFLDGSIMDVFANRRQCVTQRIYPSLAESIGIALQARGADAKIISLDAWDMAATNPW